MAENYKRVVVLKNISAYPEEEILLIVTVEKSG
jgi:hypothetical protein